MNWPQTLQLACGPEWGRIQNHPFVAAIGQGTLPDERMRYFVGQDFVYLKDFFQVLALAAVKAPRRQWARILVRHASSVFDVEQALHESVAPQLGLLPEALQAVRPGLVTVAYTDHLVRTAYTGSFAVILAALWPCYWTYGAIGQLLAEDRRSRPPVLAQWIETYAGDEYQSAVRELGQILADIEPSPDEALSMHQVHHRSMVYERLFWQQAWNGQNIVDIGDGL